MSEGTIVTFYSYKGGVGRTFALANIGALLSLWGYKTLCIDWDLEAPGLHLYFKQWFKEENLPGLTEVIHAYAEGKKPRWQDFVTEVNFSGSPQLLRLMKAGLQNKSYVQRMQTLDWDKLYSEHNFGNFLEELREDWKQVFDFVLIDSRTGITDIGGICTIQLPDILMLLLTANDQSLNGSLEVLERIQETRARFPFDRAKLLVAPIVSRFERRVEYDLADQWLARFATLFPPIYNDWVHKDIFAMDLLNHIRIPYIPYWSFGEKLPVLERGTSDPEDIGFPLETLAALVARKLTSTDILIQNRDTYVAMARNAVSQQAIQAQKLRSSVRVFISYAREDQSMSDKLEKHLSSLKRQGIIDTWSESPISTESDYEYSDSNTELEDANVILLLISSDYMASAQSDVVIKKALALLAAGQAIVIPILLRPCDWEASPIAKLRILPKGARPISKWEDQDAAWASVSSDIRKAIEGLKKSQSI